MYVYACVRCSFPPTHPSHTYKEISLQGLEGNFPPPAPLCKEMSVQGNFPECGFVDSDDSGMRLVFYLKCLVLICFVEIRTEKRPPYVYIRATNQVSALPWSTFHDGWAETFTINSHDVTSRPEFTTLCL